MLIQFSDKMVPYATFLDDVAFRVAEIIKDDVPDRMSQREAYRRFGRGNVDRWRRNGLLRTYKRPGTVEYLTSELRRCQSKSQDYFV